jgi:hypothetical protein
MSEENYMDWYDNGPGSVNWNRKRAKEENEYKVKIFQDRINNEKELELLREEVIKLRKENKKLMENQCSGKK